MTISTTTNRVSFAGNGSTTAFATGFKFFADSDLVVTLVTDSTGVEAVQTITTDYTVSGAGEASGGTVTMVTAPAVGETLVIVRAQPYTQGTDLVENDPFPSQTVEDQLDKIVIMTQQNDSAITRSLRQPDGDTVDIDRLPAKAARASKVLAFDADGDPEALTPNTDTYISLSTFMATVLDDTTAAAARTTLGAAGSDDSVTTAMLADNAVDETKLKDALIGDFTEVTVTAADSILLGDADDSGNTKRDTVQGILDLVPSSGLDAASQAEMEAATSNTVAVTPGRAAFHPGVSKAGAAVSFSGGTPSLDGDYNIASITDNGTGDITVTFDTAFSNTNYRVAGVAETLAGNTSVRGLFLRASGRAVGSCRVYVGSNSGPEDLSFTVDFFGDI